MRDPAGLVALAAAALWIAYLVPHRLRHRQQLLESRAEDRFSGALRVLAVTGRPDRVLRAGESRSECGPSAERQSVLLTPCRGIPVHELETGTVTKGAIVDRPHGTQDKISADAARRAAQRRAHRAASLARRGAAARRRAALTLGLLVLSVAGWVVVGVTTLAVVAAVIPTVALAGVLVLGRRAVISAQAADAAWDRQRRTPSMPVTSGPITGRALHPSDAQTQVIERITDEAPDPTSAESLLGEDAGADGAGEDNLWLPVPVPRSTYTTKAAAPRREPIPLVLPEPVAAEAAPASASARADDAMAPDLTDSNPTLDLDAILARRRAAG